MNDDKTRKSSFFPLQKLKDKTNYKLYGVIEEDGSILERVFLNVFDTEHREFLIFSHFISRRVKFFYKTEIGINILSRDKPWDFEIELSTNEFINIEITSIADNHWQFEMLKSEERIAKQSNNELIPLRELIKLNKLFPDKQTEDIVNGYLKENLSKDSVIKNPFFEKTVMTIGRTEKPSKKLSEIIDEAITKKEQKNHQNKEITVLIIDNRTFTFEIKDFQLALEELFERIQESPFMEIWLYTGYYSSNDGSDAEYSLMPLKITEQQSLILEELIAKNGVDDKGIYYD